MGCIPSKAFKNYSNQGSLFTNCDNVNHNDSVTSNSTYGIPKNDAESTEYTKMSPPRRFGGDVLEEAEIVNSLELMGDTENEIPICEILKTSTKPLVTGTTATNIFKQVSLEKCKPRGKENNSKQNELRSQIGIMKCGSSGQVLKPLNSADHRQNVAPVEVKMAKFEYDTILALPRRSLIPLFDAEFVAFYNRELDKQGDEMKNMISLRPRKCKSEGSKSVLELYEQNCPPGGENAVVVYTTTLRGIRKTFEECKVVKSIIESFRICTIERDISIDSGFREELRMLIGRKEVKVPLVFVKGRLIGGVDEVVKMAEERTLEELCEGIPRAGVACDGCSGMRFVMRMKCSGSCKVVHEVHKNSVRCEQCNENGLIQCPMCC